MQPLQEALAVLTAVDLLAFYHSPQGFYVIELKSPLSIEQFLKHAVYSSLLEQKISEPAVDALKPAGLQGLQDLSKRFRMSLPMSVWLKSLCLKSSPKIHLI